MKFKFKEDASCCCTDEDFYGLCEGYIDPKQLLDNAFDAQLVINAVKLVESFIDQARDAGVWEEC